MNFLSNLFGNSKNVESEDSAEDIIRDVENKPYGISKDNVLFAGLNELGGYFFFQTVIVGRLNVKSKKGAQLAFGGESFSLQLKADTQEFESEPSDIKGRYVTKVDFEIDETNIEKLRDAQLKSVALTINKNVISFKKILLSDEEE